MYHIWRVQTGASQMPGAETVWDYVTKRALDSWCKACDSDSGAHMLVFRCDRILQKQKSFSAVIISSWILTSPISPCIILSYNHSATSVRDSVFSFYICQRADDAIGGGRRNIFAGFRHHFPANQTTLWCCHVIVAPDKSYTNTSTLWYLNCAFILLIPYLHLMLSCVSSWCILLCNRVDCNDPSVIC